MDSTKKVFKCICLVVFAAVLAGCDSLQVEQIPPDEIVARSADRMTKLAGFEFLIDRSGEPVFLDYNETISFRRAEGQFNSPNQVRSTVRIIAPGLVTEVQIISTGESQWETNILSGQWMVSDPIYSFNTSRIFDPKTGIPAILANDLTDLTLLGTEELPEIPGKELYALEASLQGDYAYEMTYGMIDNDPLKVRMWIAPGSFELYRIILTDPADPGDEKDTVWQIDFWSFDQTFDIENPIINNE